MDKPQKYHCLCDKLCDGYAVLGVAEKVSRKVPYSATTKAASTKMPFLVKGQKINKDMPHKGNYGGKMPTKAQKSAAKAMHKVKGASKRGSYKK